MTSICRRWPAITGRAGPQRAARTPDSLTPTTTIPAGTWVTDQLPNRRRRVSAGLFKGLKKWPDQ
ncbi:hypothetical protein [Fodinicola feengrottensis]|uniref:hypothetical protein n=1 Tax=Fodinicola feengrottensis TaxID=435914 RepID=UPI0013D299C0|nr:hypothetical protein [Fodinicola feengrottensis]